MTGSKAQRFIIQDNVHVLRLIIIGRSLGESAMSTEHAPVFDGVNAHSFHQMPGITAVRSVFLKYG